MVEAVLLPVQRCGMFLKQPIGQQQQVIKIDGAARQQIILILAIRDGREEFEIVFRVIGGFVGSDAVHLPTTDDVQQVAGLHAGIRNPHVSQGLAGS